MVTKIMITMMILMMTTMAIQITSWSHFIRVEVLSRVPIVVQMDSLVISDVIFFVDIYD